MVGVRGKDGRPGVEVAQVETDVWDSVFFFVVSVVMSCQVST